MKDTHWSLAQLQDYFSGRMPEDLAGKLLDHLAVCQTCFGAAGEMSSALLELELWNTNVHKDEVTSPSSTLPAKTVSALQERAAAEDDPSVARRLKDWANAGKAWAALQLDVTRDAIKSSFESIASIVVPDALQFAEAQAGSRPPLRTR